MNKIRKFEIRQKKIKTFFKKDVYKISPQTEIYFHNVKQTAAALDNIMLYPLDLFLDHAFSK